MKREYSLLHFGRLTFLTNVDQESVPRVKARGTLV